jgi:DNA-binding protein HU-beta
MGVAQVSSYVNQLAHFALTRAADDLEVDAGTGDRLLESLRLSNLATRMSDTVRSAVGYEPASARGRSGRAMGKSELFAHFADRFDMKRSEAREYFNELNMLAEKELKRNGQFVVPGVVTMVVGHRKARMGRNPATGAAIKLRPTGSLKAHISKQLKDAVARK